MATRKTTTRPAATVRRRPAATARGVVPFAGDDDDEDLVDDDEPEDVEDDEDPDDGTDDGGEAWGEDGDDDQGDDDDLDDAASEWALPTHVVPADDMPTTIGEVRRKDGKVTKKGERYFVQKGRTVTFLPTANIGSMFSMAGLVRAKGDGMRSLASFEAMCKRLADVVAEWTLVYPDPKRTPRPQPYRNPEAFLGLTADEVNWLLEKAQTIGQGQADTGKGNSASEPSRSTTRARVTRR